MDQEDIRVSIRAALGSTWIGSLGPLEWQSDHPANNISSDRPPRISSVPTAGSRALALAPAVPALRADTPFRPDQTSQASQGLPHVYPQAPLAEPSRLDVAGLSSEPTQPQTRLPSDNDNVNLVSASEPTVQVDQAGRVIPEDVQSKHPLLEATSPALETRVLLPSTSAKRPTLSQRDAQMMAEAGTAPDVKCSALSKDAEATQEPDDGVQVPKKGAHRVTSGKQTEIVAIEEEESAKSLPEKTALYADVLGKAGDTVGPSAQESSPAAAATSVAIKDSASQQTGEAIPTESSQKSPKESLAVVEERLQPRVIQTDESSKSSVPQEPSQALALGADEHYSGESASDHWSPVQHGPKKQASWNLVEREGLKPGDKSKGKAVEVRPPMKSLVKPVTPLKAPAKSSSKGTSPLKTPSRGSASAGYMPNRFEALKEREGSDSGSPASRSAVKDSLQTRQSALGVGADVPKLKV